MKVLLCGLVIAFVLSYMQNSEAEEQTPAKVKVAAVRVTWGGDKQEPRDQTITRALSMAEEAAKNGAKYILLPEDLMLAYEKKDMVIPGPLTDLLVEIAKKHGVYLCAGFFEYALSEKREGEYDPYTTAAIVGPEGYISKHRKVDVLIRPQSPHYKGGQPVTDHGGFNGLDFEMHKVGDIDRVGVLICRDCFTSVAWTRVLSQDPQLIFQPNMRSSIVKYGANLPAMAKEYGVPIVAANGAADSESLIVDRDGTMLDYEDKEDRVLYGQVTLADEHPEYKSFPVILNN